MIHQDAIPFVRKVKWYIFIGLFRGSSAVFIPDVHRLPVSHKCAEPLSQAVNQLSHAYGKLLAHICVIIIASHISVPMPVSPYVRKVIVAA